MAASTGSVIFSCKEFLHNKSEGLELERRLTANAESHDVTGAQLPEELSVLHSMLHHSYHILLSL